MTHITSAQRYTISCMKENGHNQQDIADTIGKNKSTVSRELKRNSDGRSGKYRYELAVRKHEERQASKKKRLKFDQPMIKQVEVLLRDDFSPEQVVGSMEKIGVLVVSPERIYQHIWSDKKTGGDLHTHLRNKGRKYRKRGDSKDSRGVIKNRVSIEQRPKIVDKKERFGDLEIDLIIGKNHKQAILTINDRASGMLKMKKVKSKDSKGIATTAIAILEDWMPYIHTITSDNGKEFAKHESIAKSLDIDFYFAHAYHSWERGANENLNGLVRQYFPKKSDFTQLTDEKIQSIENKLNNRPRKRFNYENPIFVMDQLLFNPKVAFIT